jgi:hypothetical protein
MKHLFDVGVVYDISYTQEHVNKKNPRNKA